MTSQSFLRTRKFLLLLHQRLCYPGQTAYRPHKKRQCFHVWRKGKQAFQALKEAFTKAPILQYPDQDREFRLETDASEFAVGGVLSVKCNDQQFRPVAYMSHSMTPPERNYPIHDKEMLAIIKATEVWRHYLEATPYSFEIWTDHNNLTYFLKSQNLSKCQAVESWCWPSRGNRETCRICRVTS